MADEVSMPLVFGTVEFIGDLKRSSLQLFSQHLFQSAATLAVFLNEPQVYQSFSSCMKNHRPLSTITFKGFHCNSVCVNLINTGVCGWLANTNMALDCKSSGHSSTLWTHEGEGPFFSSSKSTYLQSLLVSVCLAFVCAARTKITVHVSDPYGHWRGNTDNTT